MALTPAHRELVRLLAEQAVKEHLARAEAKRRQPGAPGRADKRKASAR